MGQFTQKVKGQPAGQKSQQPTSASTFGLRSKRLKSSRRSDNLPTIAHQQKNTSRPDNVSPPVDQSAWPEPTVTLISCRVKTAKHSGIPNDPNRSDDPQYILRLLAKVINDSLETVEIVARLPQSGIKEECQ